MTFSCQRRPCWVCKNRLTCSAALDDALGSSGSSAMHCNSLDNWALSEVSDSDLWLQPELEPSTATSKCVDGDGGGGDAKAPAPAKLAAAADVSSRDMMLLLLLKEKSGEKAQKRLLHHVT